MSDHLINYRQVGFEVVIAAGSRGFFTFGPLAIGDVIRGIKLNLRGTTADFASLFVNVALHDLQPKIPFTATTFANEFRLFGSVDISLAADNGRDAGLAPVFNSHLPFFVRGAARYRFLTLKVEAVDLVFADVAGSIIWDFLPVDRVG